MLNRKLLALCLAILLWVSSGVPLGLCQAKQTEKYAFDHGAIIRGDVAAKRIALVFTGHEFSDGGELIREVLKKKNAGASFFFTDDFYRDSANAQLISHLIEDGRLAVISSNEGVTDPAANGEAVLYAAKVTGDLKLKQAADRMLEYLLKKAPRRNDGTIYHIANKPQVWVDSMYMAPPFLAVAGQPQEAVRQVEGIRRLLWNPEKKLFSHIWDDSKNSFFRKDCWGVGNGWAASGMTRIVKALPADMGEEKKRLVKYVKEVIDGCLARQRQDGLFHDVVDNPQTFVETNLAQMLTYTIYCGIREGWLEASYLRRAERMREAVRKKVDEYGYVQGVCGSPNFESAGTATEGQAFFLMMEAAASQLR